MFMLFTPQASGMKGYCPTSLGWQAAGRSVERIFPQPLTLNFDISHDPGLESSRSNSEKAAFQEREGRLTWNKGDVSI